MLSTPLADHLTQIKIILSISETNPSFLLMKEQRGSGIRLSNAL